MKKYSFYIYSYKKISTAVDGKKLNKTGGYTVNL